MFSNVETRQQLLESLKRPLGMVWEPVDMGLVDRKLVHCTLRTAFMLNCMMHGVPSPTENEDPLPPAGVGESPHSDSGVTVRFPDPPPLHTHTPPWASLLLSVPFACAVSVGFLLIY